MDFFPTDSQLNQVFLLITELQYIEFINFLLLFNALKIIYMKSLTFTILILFLIHFTSKGQISTYGSGGSITISPNSIRSKNSTYLSLGYNALYSNAGGAYNTAIGDHALYYNLEGSYNTALGHNSLRSNLDGNRNTANGYLSLYYNFHGQDNTAMGVNSLYSNTDGGFNTAIGSSSLNSNTIGDFNSAVGYESLKSNTIGYNNIAAGAQALFNNDSGYANTAVGVQSLYTNVEGSYNTAMGRAALFYNIGSDNTASGWHSLYSNTTGDSNTASGVESLSSNTTGSYNTASGWNSLYLNTTGDGNTANGLQSLTSNTTGGYNTATGIYSLFYEKTGFFNSAFGYSAGEMINGGTQNTFIGALSDATGDFNNSMALGYETKVNASNKVRIGNSSITVIEGQVPWSNPSDKRLKENIIYTSSLGLEFINKLKTVSYNYKADKTKTRYDGFIAQDIEEVLRDLKISFSGLKKSSDGVYSLAYSDFVMPLVNGMKEQQKQIVQQNHVIDELKKEIEVIKRLLLQNSSGK